MVYPEDAVEVGTNWTATKEQQGMTFEYTYEVVSITSDTVELEIKGNITGTADGTFDCKSSIDKETGNVDISEMNMSFSVEGQDVKSKIVITSVKK